MSLKQVCVSWPLFAAFTFILVPLSWSQQLSNLDRGRAQDMLQVVANDIRKHYYDPKFHGVDWDAAVRDARQKIDNASSMNMALSYIAAAVDALDDSHTHFLPPGKAHDYDYGWQDLLVGDRCYVAHVRPGSDAERKGLKPGDEILTINGFMPDRKIYQKMKYLFEVLRPQTSLHLLLQNPTNGSTREMEVNARVLLLKRPTDLSLNWRRVYENFGHFFRPRYSELGNELLVLKVPDFSLSNSELGSLMSKARKHRSLVLDLRGNPGGAIDTLKYLVSYFFEKDVKIADQIMRNETVPLIAKTQGGAFTGKLIVLVDSESASSSELLARTVQIEKRGIVIGDRTSGSVMEAKYYPNQIGGNLVNFYAEIITYADLTMSDGGRLEHIGVVPDEIALPTSEDLAKGRDPVLARAAEMAGVKLGPEDAGKMFPYEWPPDQE